VIVAAFGGLLLTGDSLPTAEAMIERMDRSFQASVDRHYVVHVVEEGREGVLRTNDWYFRADRWACRMSGPLGRSYWAGGVGGRVWWVPPVGAPREWTEMPAFLRTASGVEPGLPYANLRRAVQELRRGFAVTVDGREANAVRVRARREGSGPLRGVELLAEEDSGVVSAGELRFEFEGSRIRLHRFTLADQEPRGDAFYTLGGHAR
jgi:hypothetical protein